MPGKPKLALYWAASCGGCEVAVLDTNEKILDIAAHFDIVLWPVATDHKYADLRARADGEIDVCLFNGAIRNSEQREIAELVRKKSKVLVAFGACAHLGGIPGLANLFSRESILERVFDTTPSTVNPDRTRPQTHWASPAGDLELPTFYNAVYRLDDVVPVDYYLPGCPPPPSLILKAVEAIVSGQLPPAGGVLAPEKALCASCPRAKDEKKEEKKVKAFHRVHLVAADPQKCFLEQGIICCGPATRDGCEARCIAGNMPCRGCFGPTPDVIDQGAKLLGAIATLADANDPAEVKRILAGVVDPAGTFYRFSVPSSLLRVAASAVPAGDGKEAAAK